MRFHYSDPRYKTWSADVTVPWNRWMWEKKQKNFSNLFKGEISGKDYENQERQLDRFFFKPPILAKIEAAPFRFYRIAKKALVKAVEKMTDKEI